jgi:hypothetical protein
MSGASLKKHLPLTLFLVVMVLSFYQADILNVENIVHANSGTSVGGIIWSDTTWTQAGSPYTITDTVQIPENVTLVIEPGVIINKPTSGDMFLLHGTIYAHGTIDNKITFDGGGNSYLLHAPHSYTESTLDLEYCIIRNGYGLDFVNEYFSLRYSELINLTDGLYVERSGKGFYIEHNQFINTGDFELVYIEANVFIRYNLFRNTMGQSFFIGPHKDVYIEYNRFINTGCISTHLTVYPIAAANAYIRYNLFTGKVPPNSCDDNFYIASYKDENESKTVVQYNSFIDVEGMVLQFQFSEGSVAMNATSNYWGTMDTNIIDSMIYDRNDDIRSPGFIDYLPILSDPHPDTPKIPSAISCSVSVPEVALGSSITVSGSISPTVSEANVTLTYTKPDASTFNRTVLSLANGSYRDVYTPPVLGFYSVAANWLGDATHEESPSSATPFTIIKIPTTISCSVSRSEIIEGTSVIISGQLSPSISDTAVTLTYEKPDGSTFNQTESIEPDGSYSVLHDPDTLGAWNVAVSWGGDETHQQTTSDTKSFEVKEISFVETPMGTATIAGVIVAAITTGLVLLKRKSTSKIAYTKELANKKSKWNDIYSHI